MPQRLEEFPEEQAGRPYSLQEGHVGTAGELHTRTRGKLIFAPEGAKKTSKQAPSYVEMKGEVEGGFLSSITLPPGLCHPSRGEFL